MRELVDADQRLVILKSLLEAGYNANESMLQDFLELYAHRISRDAVRSHMAWLQEQGLATIKDIAGIYIATLTSRGQDVAEGRATVPGVKKPRARG